MRAITAYILLSLFVLTVARLHAKDGTDKARAGQKLFARYCAECHGATGQGTDRAPALQPYVKSSQPTMLVSFIKNGKLRAGMPSWSRLPDQQLSQIVAYLQVLADSR
jgi:mono/diheme cytochrome c family protein